MKLSYEIIRKVHRTEKESSELAKIEDDFFESLSEFISEEKTKLNESKNNLDDSVIRKLHNIKGMLNDIIYLREKKIINRAILKTKTDEDDTKNMTAEEQKMYIKITNILQSYQKQVKDCFDNESKLEKQKTVKMQMLQEVPKFIGTDMQEYGPYKEGEELELIESIAKIFIKKGIGKDLTLP